MGSKSTSLSLGSCVPRPKQYNMICWEFDHFSGFFVSSWMMFWAHAINVSAGVMQETMDADSRDQTTPQGLGIIFFPFFVLFLCCCQYSFMAGS